MSTVVTTDAATTVNREAPATTVDTGIQSFLVTFIIRRFDPEVDEEPRWVDYDVELYSTDRVLDALHKIKWEVDGSLSFRRSCAHGICGSDAMRINGRNRLACKTLIKDLDISQPIYVEAIKGLPLEKDLIVDMEPFFASFREVQPFLISNATPDARQGAHPDDRGSRDLRRHHEVHPVRGVHLVVPGVLDRRAVLRARGDRQRAPLHLRLARRRRRDAPRHPQRQRGRLALPHDLQLHRGVPPRHRGDQGHRRGEAGGAARSRLSASPRRTGLRVGGGAASGDANLTP